MFLENAGQRDLLAQFESIETEMAARMKSKRSLLLVIRCGLDLQSCLLRIQLKILLRF